jgi:hypothetical protein
MQQFFRCYSICCWGAIKVASWTVCTIVPFFRSNQPPVKLNFAFTVPAKQVIINIGNYRQFVFLLELTRLQLYREMVANFNGIYQTIYFRS